jgi:hypothetical protein
MSWFSSLADTAKAAVAKGADFLEVADASASTALRTGGTPSSRESEGASELLRDEVDVSGMSPDELVVLLKREREASSLIGAIYDLSQTHFELLYAPREVKN